MICKIDTKIIFLSSVLILLVSCATSQSLYVIDPKTIENFTTDFTTGEPYQMFKGTPYAHLMIPVEGYYIFQPESAPK